MKARQMKTTLRCLPALLLLALPLVSGTAAAATYNLVAMPFTKAMPDGTPVTMWGFALDDGTSVPSVPGPALVVPSGDTTLTVNVRNTLSAPVSIVIPGQAMPTDAGGTTQLAPVKFADGQGRQRVRSFTAEAAAGGGTQSYTWNNLKPGTYLYHSGTHPQVQVQMGLYGAAMHDALAGRAYDNVAYDSQVTLLFSEIDPKLHEAVSSGRYGQPVPDPLPPGLTAADYPSSTIDYAPRYFLINGEPHTSASVPLPAGSVGQTVLLRLLNAGLQSRSPVLQGQYMRLVAEDGRAYPYAREQYSAFLPALKTADAVITPTTAATYPLYDRRLATANPSGAGSTMGGMVAFLEVAPPDDGIPLAGNDAYATDEDVPLSVAAPGVLGNDDAGTTASLVSNAVHGVVALAADGSFTYTPHANYYGADSFIYRAMNGTLGSAPATVNLTVNPVNDAPVAAADAYSVNAGATLNVAAPGVLANDSDVDGNALTAVNASALAGLTLNADGSFSYAAPATAGTYGFTYEASDGSANSAPATVTITVNAVVNTAPVAVNDTVSAPVRRASPPASAYTPVIINVLANDTDAQNNIAPSTVQIVTPPNKGGQVTVNADGTVSYTPALNFRGTENFRYRVQDTGGLWSNSPTVRINVK